jgi:hypothetical protein
LGKEEDMFVPYLVFGVSVVDPYELYIFLISTLLAPYYASHSCMSPMSSDIVVYQIHISAIMGQMIG